MATYEFDAALDAFDLSGDRDVWVRINNRLNDSAPLVDDFLWIAAQSESYVYYLGFCCFRDPAFGVDVPSAVFLQQAASRPAPNTTIFFDMEPLNNSASIATIHLLMREALDVSVSAIPLPVPLVLLGMACFALASNARPGSPD